MSVKVKILIISLLLLIVKTYAQENEAVYFKGGRNQLEKMLSKKIIDKHETIDASQIYAVVIKFTSEGKICSTQILGSSTELTSTLREFFAANQGDWVNSSKFPQSVVIPICVFKEDDDNIGKQQLNFIYEEYGSDMKIVPVVVLTAIKIFYYKAVRSSM